MGRLSGRVAFITGAARGQGRAHAELFASEGADIIAVDVCEDALDTPYPGPTEQDLHELAAAVESLDRRIVARKVDVRDLEGLNAAVSHGIAEFGRLDIVVANAGIGLTPRLAEDITEELWENMIAVNLSGVWRTCKAAIPEMKRGGRGGSIILTSSAAGLQPYLNSAHYVTAKHGVVGLMRALALELAPHSIRVNSIHPTQVNTPMIMNDPTFQLFAPHLDKPDVNSFAEVSQSLNALPVPWLEPIDLAYAALFLASDEGRYITGVTLPVDAGILIK